MDTIKFIRALILLLFASISLPAYSIVISDISVVSDGELNSQIATAQVVPPGGSVNGLNLDGVAAIYTFIKLPDGDTGGFRLSCG